MPEYTGNLVADAFVFETIGRDGEDRVLPFGVLR
jgi:hypothetical protein